MERVMATALTRAWNALGAWWFDPLPRRRVALLRVFLYSFVVVDVLWLRPWVSDNGLLPGSQYHPLMIGRWLPLPTPTPLVVGVVKYALLAAAAVAASGRFVRLAGVLVFGLYLEWMVIAFSYGKVDHDRVAFLVALAVLPTVGKISWQDRSSDEKAAWAIRCIQVAVVATYFLSAFAKIRFGGIDWVNGATLLRAVLRRGTDLATPLETAPELLRLGQWGIMLFELSSPLLLARGRIGRLYLASAFTFHAITFAAIEIVFWPHVACLLAFLPLERLSLRRRFAPLLRARSLWRPSEST
ncbi:MAG TPA: HTTM domain-containing protein [Actinomycetota bacterium]|nr:HTTM domain-containing protein [Actinomycetota bacterium]